MTTSPTRDRIRALLAKAESTEFQAEADAFLAKAFELMAREGLTEADIKDTEIFKVESRRINLKSTTWREDQMLGGVVAKSIGCVSRVRSYGASAPAQIVFYGTRAQIDAAELMFTSLLLQRARASRRRPRRETQREFASGFAMGVYKALERATKDVEQEAPGTGLALRSMEQRIEDEVNGGRPTRQARTRAARPGDAGYSAGLTADAGMRARLQSQGPKAIGR